MINLTEPKNKLLLTFFLHILGKPCICAHHQQSTVVTLKIPETSTQKRQDGQCAVMSDGVTSISKWSQGTAEAR